jgi:hypothetical protein
MLVTMTDNRAQAEPVKILWTGGWDSTFQLLQLLLTRRNRATPYYLIDEERRSTGLELLTMKRIKAKVFERFPETRQLLDATQFFSVSDVSPNPDITRSYERVRHSSSIGSQYDWLARFCEEHGISDLQLCIHKDDRAHAVISKMVTKVGRDAEKATQMDLRSSGKDEYALFRYFSFPILGLTKPEMADIARATGFDDIMRITWFCHNPRNGKPCGVCNPCLYTIEEGLAWRIPLTRRFLSVVFRLLIRPSRRIAEHVLNKSS